MSDHLRLRLPNLPLICLISAVLTLWLTACGGEETTPTPAPSSTPAATFTDIPSPTLPAIPSATPTASPTASPPPPQPALEVNPQTVTETGELLIARAVAAAPGWLSVSNADAPAVELLGFVAIDAGSHEKLVISIDPYQANAQLMVALHADEGEPGRFDFPGEDDIVEVAGEAVQNEIRIELSIPLPGISVSDQTIWEDGIAVIDSVTSLEAGWVAISLAESPEQILGASPIPAGNSQNVPVAIPWREALPDLQAALWLDAGIPGMYEPGLSDLPVEINGEPIAAQFKATLPPEIVIFEQPVIEEQIIVDRALSDGTNWLVIYRSVNGQPGNVVGFTFLQDGLNENIVVPVAGSAITRLMFARFHEDNGELGEFDFPGEDNLKPFFDREGNRYVPQFPFRTDYGSYILAADQSDPEAVTLDKVVVDAGVWLLIHADDDGELGEELGALLLPAGFHQNVSVPIALEQTPAVVHAALYRDEGEKGAFDELDFLLQVDGAPVRLELQVTDGR